MRKLLTIFSLLLATSSAQAVSYKGCSSQHKTDLAKAVALTQQVTTDMQRQIRSKYRRLSGDDAKSMKHAEQMISCAQRRAKTNLVLECHPRLEQDAYAWTLPVVGQTIKFSHEAIALDSHRLVAIYVHELMHKCGATDAAYFHYEWTPPENQTWSGWSAIADTYGYWIRFGVCLPGHDCY